jgi:outer membrane lipoprotein carrier protein
MLRRRQLVLLPLAGQLAPAAHAAGGLDLLARFMQEVRSGRARFTQVVTSPPRAGQPPRSRTSSGELAFQRPGRFRFAYQKPFEQLIVADGQTLWLHDPDLNQVTARRQAQVLGSTPAALLTAAADLQALQLDFVLEALPEREQLQWVRATPRVAEGQVRAVQAGLRETPGGPVLVVIDIEDGLGQRSLLRLSDFEPNPSLPPETFVFRPPAGADIIRS